MQISLKMKSSSKMKILVAVSMINNMISSVTSMTFLTNWTTCVSTPKPPRQKNTRRLRSLKKNHEGKKTCWIAPL